MKFNLKIVGPDAATFRGMPFCFCLAEAVAREDFCEDEAVKLVNYRKATGAKGNTALISPDIDSWEE